MMLARTRFARAGRLSCQERAMPRERRARLIRATTSIRRRWGEKNGRLKARLDFGRFSGSTKSASGILDEVRSILV